MTAPPTVMLWPGTGLISGKVIKKGPSTVMLWPGMEEIRAQSHKKGMHTQSMKDVRSKTFSTHDDGASDVFWGRNRDKLALNVINKGSPT